VYKCSAVINDKKEIALVRLFGSGTELIIDRERETVVNAQLAKTGFGPAQYGSFANGCVYGWFEGSAATPDGIIDPFDKFMNRLQEICWLDCSAPRQMASTRNPTF
jgi:hypothetical protein